MCCAVAVLWSSPAGAEGKVGYVNPKQILGESQIGKAAQADLARMAESKEKRIRQSVSEIEVLQKELAAGALNPPDQQRKEEALRAKYEMHDRLIRDSNEEILLEEQKLARNVMQKADVFLRQIASKGGYTIIISDPEAVGYVDPSADLTLQIIKALDQGGKK